MFDFESFQSIDKEHIYRASGVNKDSTNVVIDNIDTDDHGVRIEEDDALSSSLEKVIASQTIH